MNTRSLYSRELEDTRTQLQTAYEARAQALQQREERADDERRRLAAQLKVCLSRLLSFFLFLFYFTILSFFFKHKLTADLPSTSLLPCRLMQTSNWPPSVGNWMRWKPRCASISIR